MPPIKIDTSLAAAAPLARIDEGDDDAYGTPPSLPPPLPLHSPVATARRAAMELCLSPLKGAHTLLGIPTTPPASLGRARRMYVCSREHAADGALLDSLGTTHLVRIFDDCALPQPPPTLPSGRPLRVHTLNVTDAEGAPLLTGAPALHALQFMNTALTTAADNVVTVHCYAGVNRSAALAALYAMVRDPSVEASSALHAIGSIRGFAMSNISFRAQLAATDTAAWRARLKWDERLDGVLDDVPLPRACQ